MGWQLESLHGRNITSLFEEGGYSGPPASKLGGQEVFGLPKTYTFNEQTAQAFENATQAPLVANFNICTFFKCQDKLDLISLAQKLVLKRKMTQVG